MSTTHDLSTLNGDYKNSYASKIANFIPYNVKFYKKYKFIEGEKLGKEYLQPVFLTEEQGATYAGPGVPANLNASITSTLDFAHVNAYQLLVRSTIGYGAISRSEGSNAYMNAHVLVAANLRASHLKKLEAEFIYGQAGWGTVAAKNNATGEVTITTSEWGPGLWVGKENIQIDFVRAGVVVATHTIPASSSTIPTVDVAARKLRFDSVIDVQVGDTLYPKGAFNNQMIGVHQMLASIGTVFGLDSSAYSIWLPSIYNVAGSATFAKLNKAMTLGLPKGLEGKATCWCNPGFYTDLVDEIEGARDFADKNVNIPGRVERGANSLMFYGAACETEVIPHASIKEGYAYLLIDDDSWRRVGSTDVTNNLPIPGQDKGDIFLHSPNQMSYEIRSYSDMALFCANRGANVLLTGITNTV